MDEKRWERRLNRERTARKEAETLLEQKSLELWEANQALSSMADDLKLKEQAGLPQEYFLIFSPIPEYLYSSGNYIFFE